LQRHEGKESLVHNRRHEVRRDGLVHGLRRDSTIIDGTMAVDERKRVREGSGVRGTERE
jgi:hypothetical protein